MHATDPRESGRQCRNTPGSLDPDFCVCRTGLCILRQDCGRVADHFGMLMQDCFPILVIEDKSRKKTCRRSTGRFSNFAATGCRKGLGEISPRRSASRIFSRFFCFSSIDNYGKVHIITLVT